MFFLFLKKFEGHKNVFEKTVKNRFGNPPFSIAGGLSPRQ